LRAQYANCIISADGIALGAAASTTRTDIEMIVFLAIMLHKVCLLVEITLTVDSFVQ